MYTKINLYDDLKCRANFFANIYTYFIRGGYKCIFIENILNIIIMFMTLALVLFVCFWLDWYKIGECQSDSTCDNFNMYIIRPFLFHNKSSIIFMIIFMVIFAIYWVWTTFVLVVDLFKYIDYKKFFEQNLEIKLDELKVLSWTDIVNKLKNYDNSLTTEGIVGSIMKKNNYLIAMVDANIFGINTLFYTNTFLWLIDVCIFNQIFPRDTNQINFTAIDKHKIKKIVSIIGIIQILLLPFTVVIMLAHYIINFTTDIYTKKTYIGPKEWTLYAKLLFREYNELLHVFNERIKKSYKYAVQYEEKFSAHMMNIVMEKIIFLFGTYLTILVCLTLWDERKVMYITLLDRNLLWYLAMLTSIITIARYAIVDTSSADSSAEEIMHHIIKYTHYHPKKWENNYNSYFVYKEYQSLYKYKIIGVLTEIISLIVIPFYMIIKIPNDIDNIINFMEENTTIDKQIGYVCKQGVMNYIPTIESRELINVDDMYSSECDKQKRSSRSFLSYYSKSLDEKKARIEKEPLLSN